VIISIDISGPSKFDRFRRAFIYYDGIVSNLYRRY